MSVFLTISDTLVDLPSDQVVALNFVIFDTFKLAIEKNDFSKDIDLPATKRNKLALGNLHDVNDAITYINRKRTFEARIDSSSGISIIGRATILRTFRKGGLDFFKIQIIGGGFDWIKRIQGHNLNELQYGSFILNELNYNLLNSQDSSTTDFILPPFDYNDDGVTCSPNELTVNLGFVRPALFVVAIIRKIFDNIDYTVEYKGDFTNSADFQNMMHPFSNGKFILDPLELALMTVTASDSSNDSTDWIFQNDFGCSSRETYFVPTLSLDAGNALMLSNGNLRPITSGNFLLADWLIDAIWCEERMDPKDMVDFTVPDNVIKQLDAGTEYPITVRFTERVPKSFAPNCIALASFDFGFRNKVEVLFDNEKIGFTVFDPFEPPWGDSLVIDSVNNIGIYNDGQNDHVFVDFTQADPFDLQFIEAAAICPTSMIELNPGFRWLSRAPICTVDVTITAINADEHEVGEGSTLNLDTNEQNKPNMDQFEFLRSLKIKLNLAFLTDPSRKVLTIISRTEFFKSEDDFDEWTDKIDYGSKQDMDSADFGMQKNLRFSHTETADNGDEIDDEGNKPPLSEGYGSFTFTLQNEFLIGEQEVKTGFSASAMQECNSLWIPYTKIEKSNTIGFRILVWRGLVTGDYDLKTNSGTTAKTSFPYSYFVNNATGASLSDLNLTFNSDLASLQEGTIDKFWIADLEVIDNGIVWKTRVYLSDADIVNLDMSKLVVVKGNYYLKKSVSDYLLSGTRSTTVRLISLIKPPTL